MDKTFPVIEHANTRHWGWTTYRRFGTYKNIRVKRTSAVLQAATSYRPVEYMQWIMHMMLLYLVLVWFYYKFVMMTPSNGYIFSVTGLLCGEFPAHRWIPVTKANDVYLWCFLWCAPEETVEQIIETPVILGRPIAHYDVTVMMGIHMRFSISLSIASLDVWWHGYHRIGLNHRTIRQNAKRVHITSWTFRHSNIQPYKDVSLHFAISPNECSWCCRWSTSSWWSTSSELWVSN